MTTRLTEAEVAASFDGLADWSRSGEEIRKAYTLPSFPAAIAFVLQVGFLAETAGHHPDIDIRYTRVTLAMTTHDVGGLSAKDFELARQIDALI
ncbi:MAG: 4a-hydroxytetrahydrobiopterin dehydratase [Roseiflexaceae bacterium]|nr:4a-hydroxytetrahydrobiopterin dehydratase [Roseiflexaceae bacterium]